MEIKLDILLDVLAIVVPLVAWVILLINSAKKRAVIDTNLIADIRAIKTDVVNDIKSIKDSLDNLNHIVGNGGYGGLRDSVQKIEIDMRGLKEQVRAMQADITDLKTSDTKNTNDKENDARDARNILREKLNG